MKIYGVDNKELMLVTAIERGQDGLIIKGKFFGTMPITMKVPPETVRSAFGMMSWRTMLFAVTLLFRGSTRDRKG